jgi:hypothetical protein
MASPGRGALVAGWGKKIAAATLPRRCRDCRCQINVRPMQEQEIGIVHWYW